MINTQSQITTKESQEQSSKKCTPGNTSFCGFFLQYLHTPQPNTLLQDFLFFYRVCKLQPKLFPSSFTGSPPPPNSSCSFPNVGKKVVTMCYTKL